MEERKLETVESVMSRMDVTEAEAANVAAFINGLLLKADGGLEAGGGEERACGKTSGPCCGGKCG